MEMLGKMTLSDKQMQAINQCRLYLQVLMVANIPMADERSITEKPAKGVYKANWLHQVKDVNKFL